MAVAWITWRSLVSVANSSGRTLGADAEGPGLLHQGQFDVQPRLPRQAAHLAQGGDHRHLPGRNDEQRLSQQQQRCQANGNDRHQPGLRTLGAGRSHRALHEIWCSAPLLAGIRVNREPAQCQCRSPRHQQEGDTGVQRAGLGQTVESAIAAAGHWAAAAGPSNGWPQSHAAIDHRQSPQRHRADDNRAEPTTGCKAWSARPSRMVRPAMPPRSSLSSAK